MRLTHDQVERYKVLLEHWVLYRDQIPRIGRLDSWQVPERPTESVFDSPVDYSVDPMSVETRMRIITFYFERIVVNRNTRLIRVWAEDFWMGDIRYEAA